MTMTAAPFPTLPRAPFVLAHCGHAVAVSGNPRATRPKPRNCDVCYRLMQRKALKTERATK